MQSRASGEEPNDKRVVYPRLWKTLWTTAVTSLLGGAAAIGILVLLGESFGYLRAVVGALMFYGIFIVGVRYMQFLVAAPPEPDVADVSGYGLRYVCTMCGLELRVEVAAKDKPPIHCMEPMVLVRDGGRAPSSTSS